MKSAWNRSAYYLLSATISAILGLSCKGFDGAFTDKAINAFKPGSTMNLPKAGGGTFGATVIDMTGDGVADGLDLNGDGVPEILFLVLVIGERSGLDLNGDGTIDYYLTMKLNGDVSINASGYGTGASVSVTTNTAGQPTGFNTTGSTSVDNNILSQIYADVTIPTASVNNAGGTYTAAQTVRVSCSDNIACNAIAYTLDGSTPNFAENGSVVAGNAADVSISKTGTLRYVTRDGKGNTSTVGSVSFVISGGNGCIPNYYAGTANCALSLSNNVTTIAGPAQGASTSGDTEGTGNAARFFEPYGLTTDGTNLYIGDWSNHKIRKIVIATGQVTTLAGPPQSTAASGDLDGTGNAARFNNPGSLTTDGTNLYATDYANNKIRKLVISTGVVTTFAGPAQGTTTAGDTDGTGNAARFNGPTDITTDGTNLYVADYTNNKIRQIVIATAAVTTLAGPLSGTTTSGDTDATGNAARFSRPAGVTTDGTNLYVADFLNHKIRKIVISTGVVTTIAGPAQGTTTFGDTDATGNAARFRNPFGITMDGTNLYVADRANNKLRKIVIATGVVTTFAGPAQGTTTSGDTDGIGNLARFEFPSGLATDGTSLFTADFTRNKIRRIQ